MYTLEHHLLVQPVECDDTFVAQQVRRMVRDQAAKERLQALLVERDHSSEHKRLHLVVMLVVIFCQKARLDFQNAVQREPADVQQIRDWGRTKIHRAYRRARG